MAESFRYRRRVEFRDTDAAGIMHFSVFFNFMESAEHEFWRHLGHSVLHHDGQTAISWPRVAANCNYASALRFEEEVDIEVAIARLGESSVTFQFDFRVGDRAVARGEMTAVCCRLPADGPPESMPIPADIRELLAPYEATSN